MRLKLKITFGFFIIAIMLFIAGAWSIVQVKSAQNFLEELLNNNLQKNLSSLHIYESLKKNYEAGILLSTGKIKEGKTLLAKSDSLFNVTLQRLNGVEKDKAGKEIINKIFASHSELVNVKKTFSEYYAKGEISLFISRLYFSVKKVENNIKELQLFYIKKMEELKTKIGESEDKSITPGLVAMTAAILFAILFSFFVNHYIVTPIITIRKKVDDFTEKGIPYEYDLESQDEIAELSESIRILSTRVPPKE